MSTEQHLEGLRTIFREVFDDEALQIHSSTRKSEIPGWDSVETVRILVAIEETYDLRLSMSDVATLDSVADFLALIDAKQNPEEPKSANAPTSDSMTIPVSIAGTSTTTFLRESLERISSEYGLDLNMYESDFGSFHQELLDSNSRLYKHDPKFIILHANWRDLSLPPIAEDVAVEIERIVSEWKKLWQVILQHSDATILQFAFDIPETTSESNLGWLSQAGRSRIIHEANLELAKVAPDGVLFLPSPQSSSASWTDERAWLSQRQHPSHQALGQLSKSLLLTMRAALGITRKLLVMDLDDTIWGGVIGEVGVGGIDLGPTSARGEAYQMFQAYAKELMQRGILLAVCSKNDITRAKSAFTAHDSMILNLADFIDFQANWDRKSDNIRRIAESANLGLNSIVFVDDSPTECEEVRLALPEVLTICIEGDPADITSKIHESGAFEAISLSSEDKLRTNSYTQEKERKELAKNSVSYQSYLRGLCMKIEIAQLDTTTLQRASQLINKTNQFNLSLKRRTTAELNEFITNPISYARIIRLSDKFGDYGWIGVVLAQANQSTLTLDTLLMSCRVFARGVENVILDAIVNDAIAMGANNIVATYYPSDRNELVRDYLLKNGFTATKSHDSKVQFCLQLDNYTPNETYFEKIYNSALK